MIRSLLNRFRRASPDKPVLHLVRREEADDPLFQVTQVWETLRAAAREAGLAEPVSGDTRDSVRSAADALNAW